MGEDASKSCRKRLGPQARQDRVEGAACVELWSQQAEEIWGRGTRALSSDSLPSDSSTKVVEKGRGRRSQTGTGATARTRLGEDAPASCCGLCRGSWRLAGASELAACPHRCPAVGTGAQWVELAGGTRTGRWLKPEVAAGSLQIQTSTHGPGSPPGFFRTHKEQLSWVTRPVPTRH